MWRVMAWQLHKMMIKSCAQAEGRKNGKWGSGVGVEKTLPETVKQWLHQKEYVQRGLCFVRLQQQSIASRTVPETRRQLRHHHTFTRGMTIVTDEFWRGKPPIYLPCSKPLKWHFWYIFDTATKWARLHAENFQLQRPWFFQGLSVILFRFSPTCFKNKRVVCLLLLGADDCHDACRMPAFRMGASVPSCPGPELNQDINTWFLQEDMCWQCLWVVMFSWNLPRESAARQRHLATTPYLLLLSVGDCQNVRLC